MGKTLSFFVVDRHGTVELPQGMGQTPSFSVVVDRHGTLEVIQRVRSGDLVPTLQALVGWPTRVEWLTNTRNPFTLTPRDMFNSGRLGEPYLSHN